MKLMTKSTTSNFEKLREASSCQQTFCFVTLFDGMGARFFPWQL